MAVKALLVYPKFPDTYWGFKHSLKFIGKKSSYPPLGLMTVAAMLPDDFTPRIVDMGLGPLKDADLEWADIVFLSAMLIQKPSLENVLRRCSAMGKRTVLGGPYASSSAEPIPGVKHLVQGEAETILPIFLADYRAGRAAPVYRSDSRPDLCLTPVPRFDLVDVKNYFSMAVQFSRGCPFNCEFCDIIELFGRVPRTKPSGRMLAELEALYRTGYRGSLFFVDDNFIGNAPKVKELLRSLRSWQRSRGMPFQFYTESSVNLAQDPELLSLMKDSGFGMVFLGIETPVKDSLASANKPQNLKSDLALSVRKVQRAGIEVTAGFILGFDADPHDIARRQIEFIQSAGIPTAMVGLLTALPGTQLERRLKSEGRLLSVSRGNNTYESELNFVPVMPAATLVGAYEEVLTELYRPSVYFKRCSTLLGRLPGKRSGPRARFDPDSVFLYARALFRSIFIQGLSGYGGAYLRFILRTIVARPRHFVAAVKLAIFGHHFFTLRESKILEKRRAKEAFRACLDALAKAAAWTERRLRGLSAGTSAAAASSLYKKIATSLASAFGALEDGLRDEAAEALGALGHRMSLSLYGIKVILAEKAREIRNRSAPRSLFRLEGARDVLLSCARSLADSYGNGIEYARLSLFGPLWAALDEPIRLLAGN